MYMYIGVRVYMYIINMKLYVFLQSRHESKVDMTGA